MIQIRQAIFDWAAAHLPGVTLIWRDVNPESPPRPYATIKVNTTRRLGRPSRQMEGADFEVTQHQAEATCEIQIYGDPRVPEQGIDLIEQLHDSLNSSLVLESLRESGVAYLRTAVQPTDVTAIQGTVWEPRGITELVFGFCRTQATEIGTFETVVLNGDAINENE